MQNVRTWGRSRCRVVCLTREPGGVGHVALPSFKKTATTSRPSIRSPSRSKSAPQSEPSPPYENPTHLAGSNRSIIQVARGSKSSSAQRASRLGKYLVNGTSGRCLRWWSAKGCSSSRNQVVQCLATALPIDGEPKGTVKLHITAILKALNVKTRTGAVMAASQLDFTAPKASGFGVRRPG